MSRLVTAALPFIAALSLGTALGAQETTTGDPAADPEVPAETVAPETTGQTTETDGAAAETGTGSETGTATTAETPAEAGDTATGTTETGTTDTDTTGTETPETETPDTDTTGTAAEDTDTEGTATTDTPAEGEAAAETTQQQQPAEDPTYIKETYNDWQLKCFRSEGQEDLCQMYQLLKEEAGNPVAEFSIFKLPENGQAVAGATIVVPLGTLLPEQLLLSIDGGKAKSFAYSFCSMVGCFARIGLTQGDVDAFKRGAKATMQIVPAQAPDRKVNIPVSLSGFTAAYDNVSTVQN